MRSLTPTLEIQTSSFITNEEFSFFDDDKSNGGSYRCMFASGCLRNILNESTEITGLDGSTVQELIHMQQ